jgi:hypothetical protein
MLRDHPHELRSSREMSTSQSRPFGKPRCEDRTISDGIQTPTVAHFSLWRPLCMGGAPLLLWDRLRHFKAHGTRTSEKITPRRTTTCRRQPRRAGEGLSTAQPSDSSGDEVEARHAQRHAVQTAVANRRRVDRVPDTFTPAIRPADVETTRQTSSITLQRRPR